MDLLCRFYNNSNSSNNNNNNMISHEVFFDKIAISFNSELTRFVADGKMGRLRAKMIE